MEPAEELRILRRVVSKKQEKQNKGPSIRIRSFQKGRAQPFVLTRPLFEVPPPDSNFEEDVARLVDIAYRHAEERCRNLGYDRILSIAFNGKVWEAQLESTRSMPF